MLILTIATFGGIEYADTISSGRKWSAHTNCTTESLQIYLLFAKFHAKELFFGTLNREILGFFFTLEHPRIEHFLTFILNF